MKQEMQLTESENKRITASRIRLNDIAFRLIVIPLCGIAIPLLTHMIEPDKLPHDKLKLAFLFTIGISFIIFHGNRYLHSTLRSYFDWHEKPYHKIIALIIVIPFFTVPVSIILLVLWYQVFQDGNIQWPVIKQTTLVIMLAVVFIVHIYETVFLVKEAESEMVRRAETERARTQAELDALKNQIDPHFMFNSLNTLSHLIDTYPEKAATFNEHLADVYRYILTHKSRDLVLLSEEMAFLESYFALLRIRFESSLRFQMDVPNHVWDEYLVPPISLQIPAENAIKHNEFSDDIPLVMRLQYIHPGKLEFSNDIRRKKQIKTTTGVGLENLQNRYALLTQQRMVVINDGVSFRVILPLVSLTTSS